MKAERRVEGNIAYWRNSPMTEDPVLITCAVTGGATLKAPHPHVPITPKEIAASCIEAAKAGAAIAHIHVRDPVTGKGSQDPVLYREVVSRVRDSGVDVVINLSSGGYARFFPDAENERLAGPGTNVMPVEDRIRHVVENLPEMCSLNTSTGNHSDGHSEFVYLNTTRTLRKMATRFKELGVKPEIEVYQAGDILFARQLIKEGLIEGRPMFQFVLGIQWGSPADPETVMYMRNLLPEGGAWAALGISRMQMPMAAQSILLGGNVRVGLEDNLYLDRGVQARNEDLVSRAVEIAQRLGRNVASPADARRMMGLTKR
jgi:uncharacterized protein (DUF849 family)